MPETWLLALMGGVLIGLAAGGFYLFAGEIAGITGVVRRAMSGPERGWRVAFLSGMVVAALIWLATADVAAATAGLEKLSLPVLIAAGLLVGIGTDLGNGCTSGHGVCGLSRFSLRSLVAVSPLSGRENLLSSSFKECDAMPVQGLMFVAGEPVKGASTPFTAAEAATGSALQPQFATASIDQVEQTLAAAAAAAPAFAASAPAARAALLEAMGEAILAIGEELIDRAMAETGLPRPRLEGERMRTVNQLRLFATHLREGEFAGVRIDHADPARASGPKPDLRLTKRALGPVAVFGASNFPLAFSVAGGDTASALAAGCPVVVKGHPAHPGTGELVAGALSAAVAASELPAGTFSFLQDGGIGVGQALVSDARIKAVGFTGSRGAGEALVRLAAARSEPIPVYAEMSATNPVVLLPARLAEAAEQIGTAFVGSLTLGTGQFCTNPGLVFAIEGDGLERFLAAAADAVATWAPGVMLTPGICSAFAASSSQVSNHSGVSLLAESGTADLRASAKLLATDAATFLANPDLHHEMFGPAALVVRCSDLDQLADVLAAVEGQLTVAIHFNDADHIAARRLLPIAMDRAGRVLANGFGTGVEVSPAMVHGGPYPSTSDCRTSSVGTMAIERFLRPVCLQDFPEDLLPETVRESNPWGMPRRVWS